MPKAAAPFRPQPKPAKAPRELGECTPKQLPPLLGASKAQLTEWVQTQQQPAYRGQQLHQWIYQKGIRSLGEVTVFSKQWRESAAHIPVGRSTLQLRSEAQDGTLKYLLRLTDGQIIETVGIPTDRRLTVCVSSQVGRSRRL
jgi:23S rRNA (adenine2503-C2)-methyltransferase